jgi:hypothetical protein
MDTVTTDLHNLRAFVRTWGLDIREGFFKPRRARPSHVCSADASGTEPRLFGSACGRKGLGNLAQASYLLSPECFRGNVKIEA